MKEQNQKRSSWLVLALMCLLSLPVRASDNSDFRDSGKFSAQSELAQKGSVYVYGDQSLDNLVPIRVLGAVFKPGIHYVPQKTDLVTLISLAGGPIERADLKAVTIKRQGKSDSDEGEVIRINLESSVQDPKTKAIPLMANDIIMIPQDLPIISDNSLRTITLITGFATVFSAIVIGVTQLKK